MWPSRMSNPTVAESSILLRKEIVFQSSPLTATSVVEITVETPIVFAVDHWNCENVRFETVFEPATNAPSAPINGAKKDHAGPATEATPSARTSGMDSKPESLMPD